MERNDQPPPRGTPSVMAARTRTCPTCRGKKGKYASSAERRDRRTVGSKVWQDCTRCTGTGQVLA